MWGCTFLLNGARRAVSAPRGPYYIPNLSRRPIETGDIERASLAGKSVPSVSEFVSTHSTRLKFKVVFVSSDHDRKGFDEHRSGMSFNLAVPFGSPACKDLRVKLAPDGIPALIILGKDGSIICMGGRDKVRDDVDAEEFPWPGATPSLLSTLCMPDAAKH